MAVVEEEDRLAAAEAGNAGTKEGISTEKLAIKDALAKPASGLVSVLCCCAVLRCAEQCCALLW